MMMKPASTIGLRAVVAAVTVLFGTGAAAIAAAEQTNPTPEVAAPVADQPQADEVPLSEVPTSEVATTGVTGPSTADASVDEVAPTTEAPAPEATDVAEDPVADPVPADEAQAPADPVPSAPVAVPVPAAHDEEEHEHDGAVILVNGQPFHGQADPKLDGCSITLAISELGEGSHTVAGAVAAGEPSGEGALVAFDEAFEGTSWTETWALDDLVGDLTQKPNGYRIRVEVAIDGGASATSRPFWLACGAPQSGDPYVVVLDKEWLDPDGGVLDGPPAALPDDWAITATSQLGSATCTYPEGATELVCTYENKGAHQGSADGLYVPGGKGKSFTVAETALPAGWSNVSGLGTFEPRELCPRGDDGHEDDDHEHEEHATLAPEEEEEGGVCEHVVVNQQDEVPETTTTTEATTTTEVTTTTEGPQVAPAGEDRTPGTPQGTLARTGTESLPLALVGAASVALGIGALVLQRRRLGRAR
jgi:hypothetical protein